MKLFVNDSYMQYIIYKRYIDKNGILPQNLIKLIEKMTVNHLFCKRNILNTSIKLLRK